MSIYYHPGERSLHPVGGRVGGRGTSSVRPHAGRRGIRLRMCSRKARAIPSQKFRRAPGAGRCVTASHVRGRRIPGLPGFGLLRCPATSVAVPQHHAHHGNRKAKRSAPFRGLRLEGECSLELMPRPPSLSRDQRSSVMPKARRNQLAINRPLPVIARMSASSCPGAISTP